MAETEASTPQGERLRKAVQWVGEMQIEHPNRERLTLLREAALRYNLTPAESEFLEQKFSVKVSESSS